MCFDPSNPEESVCSLVCTSSHAGRGSKTIMNQEIKDDEAPFKMKDGVTAYLHIVAKASLAFATSSNYLYWISTMSTKKRSEA